MRIYRKSKLLSLLITSLLVIITAVIISLIFFGGDLKLFNIKDVLRHKKKNIFFVLIDTLRADHLGCYGYTKNTSPNIDKIADQALLFTNFYSVCPWTDPAIASLFTGFYPQSVFPPAHHKNAIRQILPKKLDTLAEILDRENFRTVALVDHPGINRRRNFDQGFDEFINLTQKRGWHEWAGTRPTEVLEDLSEQLDKKEKDNLFMYVHLIYPHQPYIPPLPFKEMFGHGFENVSEEEMEGVINMYDAEIRYTDELIGGIFDALRQRNLLDDSYVIITSDHGEGFWEHGLSEHGNSLFKELLEVPLIIYPPGGRINQPARVDDLLSIIDLFPTILDFARIKNVPQVNGKSLIGYFKQKGDQKNSRTIFSENPHSLCIFGISCQTERYKFIYAPIRQENYFLLAKENIESGKFTFLYDIQNDPSEKNNMNSIKKSIVKEMGTQLIRHKIQNEERRRMIGSEQKSVKEDTVNKLRSLGYLK